MANTYRVDMVHKLSAGQDYRVPCGMNTIIWISDIQPNLLHLTKHIANCLRKTQNVVGTNKTPKNVGIYSKWDTTLNNYKIVTIIEAEE